MILKEGLKIEEIWADFLQQYILTICIACHFLEYIEKEKRITETI
jgi:hypothetical protein